MRGIRVCLLLGALALAGCDRGKPSDAGATGAGAQGEVYRLPLTDNPVTLDPARFTDVNSEGVAARIFSTLVRLDAGLQPAPDLAESWEISPDGLVYTFHLRRGAKFHNGREVVADDVRFSYERLLLKDTLSHRAWVVDHIAGAGALRDSKADSLAGLETPDAYTVRLRLEEPFGPLLSLLAMTNAAILPQEEVRRATDVPFGRRPVGSGPFRFVQWRDNDIVELTANEDYYAGRPALAGLQFRVIKEPLVAFQEYQAGHLEHCAVPEGYLETVRRGPRKAELLSAATLSTYYLGITMTHEPAGSNVHLRRAMNYAIDRRFLCEKLLGGAHTAARGVLPPGLAAYNADLKGYAADPARAREELRLSGFGPGGRELPEMVLYFVNQSPGPQVVQAVQNDLRKVGIPVRLRPLDLGALLAATGKAEPDLFRLAWIGDFPDADNFLQLFHSGRHGSAGNRAHYTNAEVDKLLDSSRRETDPARRIELLRQVEQIVVDDAPWIFLSHGQTHLLVQPYVQNFAIGPMDVGASVNHVDFTKVSFTAAKGK